MRVRSRLSMLGTLGALLGACAQYTTDAWDDGGLLAAAYDDDSPAVRDGGRGGRDAGADASKPDSDAGDAGATECDPSWPLGTAVPVAGLPPTGRYARFTDDELRVVLQITNPATSDFMIVTATRASREQPFEGYEIPAGEFQDGRRQISASFDRMGNNVMFSRLDADGNYAVMHSSRGSDGLFAAPSVYADRAVHGFMAPDGRTFFYELVQSIDAGPDPIVERPISAQGFPGVDVKVGANTGRQSPLWYEERGQFLYFVDLAVPGFFRMHRADGGWSEPESYVPVTWASPDGCRVYSWGNFREDAGPLHTYVTVAQRMLPGP